jgi:hypothetical protein
MHEEICSIKYKYIEACKDISLLSKDTAYNFMSINIKCDHFKAKAQKQDGIR